jgi:hypothetical protein
MRNFLSRLASDRSLGSGSDHSMSSSSSSKPLGRHVFGALKRSWSSQNLKSAMTNSKHSLNSPCGEFDYLDFVSEELSKEMSSELSKDITIATFDDEIPMLSKLLDECQTSMFSSDDDDDDGRTIEENQKPQYIAKSHSSYTLKGRMLLSSPSCYTKKEESIPSKIPVKSQGCATFWVQSTTGQSKYVQLNIIQQTPQRQAMPPKSRARRAARRPCPKARPKGE